MIRTKSLGIAFAIILSIGGPRASTFLENGTVTCLVGALILIVLASMSDEMKTRA